ncbi:MAG: PAS domain S-box protein, partial [bacterium]
LWVNGEDRQRVVVALRAGRAVVGQEYPFRTKSGEVITGLFSARTIQLSYGPCILASISDITERKRAEEQIKSQLEELQRWQDVMLGREDRVQELKREVNDLCRRTGGAARYPSQEAGSEGSGETSA